MSKKPLFNIKINGHDKKLSDRISKISITEKRDGQADRVTVVISNHDQTIPIPKNGEKMELSLGYEGDILVDKRGLLLLIKFPIRLRLMSFP